MIINKIVSRDFFLAEDTKGVCMRASMCICVWRVWYADLFIANHEQPVEYTENTISQLKLILHINLWRELKLFHIRWRNSVLYFCC